MAEQPQQIAAEQPTDFNHYCTVSVHCWAKEEESYVRFLGIWHNPTGSCIHCTDEQLEGTI